jgi:hypothetical protein
MGVLKVRVNGVWEDVGVSLTEPPLDEVWIGPAPPDPVGTYEVWVDTVNPLAPALKYKEASGAWREVSTGNEVVVGTQDPYVIDPQSKAELWHNTGIGQSGKLFARIGGPNGQWSPVAEFNESEVEINSTDPHDQGIPPGTTELWVDTSNTPALLKAWVNAGWQVVGGTDMLPAPQEVEIGPAQPRETTVELWYDTTNTPGELKANNNGVWETVGGNEVVVGNTDPYQSGAPAGSVELWVDTSGGAPGVLKVYVGGQWQPVIRFGGVAYEKQYGQDPIVGTLDIAARADHSHGTPDEEVWVGPDDPAVPDAAQNPARAPGAELWYDTDAVATVTTNTQQFAALTQRIAELEAAVRRLGGMS